MSIRHGFAMNGEIFAIFGTGPCMADCDWRRKFFKEGDGFCFLYP